MKYLKRININLKKINKYLILTLVAFNMFAGSVFAYGYDINITSKSVTVGNSVTLKITGDGVGGRFNITSSNTAVASLSDSSVWVENNTKSITINTKKAGTTTLTITPGSISTTDDSPRDITLDKKTIVLTVNEKPAPKPSSGGSTSGSNNKKPVTKSTNSYLSSLTVDNLELNEEFDKEKLEYTLTAPADTEKIKINAQLADSNANAAGLGEKNVTVGLNTFEIVVTAENGSKRTYTLKATVEELKPIKVKIGNEELMIVRKRKDLPKISEYFEAKDLEIDNELVEGYHNEVLKYDAIGLKNGLGEINYYIYKDGKYTKYDEYTFNGTVLQVLDKEIAGKKKTNFIYDSRKIASYQEVKLDYLKNTYALDNNDIGGNQFYLFYAINVETGKESLYQYDASEKTIQRYNTLVLDLYKERSDKYYIYLISSILLLGVVIVSFSIILISKNKHNKLKLVRTNIVKEEFKNIDNILEDTNELPIKKEINKKKSTRK